MGSSHEEYFFRWHVGPREMDALWAEGWRHFGPVFFRYRRGEYGGRGCTVMPLRIDLARFAPSRSQRRVIAKNRDARVRVEATVVTAEMLLMFERHKARFSEEVPDSLGSFLSFEPASVPCPNVSILVHLEGRLAAASFLDVGHAATSAVYAMFDPAHARRSLGIFTMLEAIRYSRAHGRRYYYPGYACLEPSVYDYKKNFAGLEHFDWRGAWLPLGG
ncbi:MAG: arginine-tRNA-protein transferase, partial [Acidobacteriota bacterium]|nr:arginine-tRNA-protein transferase [Acidobacteriota bacterium]